MSELRTRANVPNQPHFAGNFALTHRVAHSHAAQSRSYAPRMNTLRTGAYATRSAAACRTGADGRSATVRPPRPCRRRRARRARAPPRPAGRARPTNSARRSRASSTASRRSTSAAACSTASRRRRRRPAQGRRATTAGRCAARDPRGGGQAPGRQRPRVDALPRVVRPARARGHEIAGKDPLAVFLTQISRSPAMRTRHRARAIYELDRRRRHRLRHAIDAPAAESCATSRRPEPRTSP